MGGGVGGGGGAGGAVTSQSAAAVAAAAPMKRRRWYLGIQSKKDPAHVMTEVSFTPAVVKSLYMGPGFQLLRFTSAFRVGGLRYDEPQQLGLRD